MSCTAPAPQNVNASNFKPGKCSYKCEYKFTYGTINDITVTSDDKNGFFKFQLNKEVNPSVEYNSTKYTATEFQLYHTPIHNYGSDDIKAELIIIHTATSGNADVPQNLYVCIPVQIIDNTAGEVLDNLLSEIGNNAPLPDNDTPLIINPQNLKLSKFIPEKEYVVYLGTDFTSQSCKTPNTEYIIFKDTKSALIISTAQATRSGFLNLPTEHNTPPVDKNPSFYASDFVPGTSLEDDIYIDCKPVETTSTKKELTSLTTGPPAFLSGFSIGDIFKTLYPYIFVLIGALLMFGMWKLGWYLFGPKCPGAHCASNESALHPKLKCPTVTSKK